VFTQTPEAVEVTEGDDLDLVCKAIGRPVPDITWYMDKKPLDRQDECLALSQSQEGDEANSMVALRNIQPPRHSGKYTIEAANSVGTATHTVMVTG
jgi:hypothetical protein